MTNELMQPTYSYLVQVGKPHELAICDTLRGCSHAVRNYINNNDLSAPDWYENENVGAIMHPILGVIGNVSYNGKVWYLDGLQVIEGLDNLLTIDLESIILSHS